MSQPFHKGFTTLDREITLPCRSLFQRAAAIFSPNFSHNSNVNLARLADRFVALTEMPLPVEFDLESLETLGIPEFEDKLGFGSSTAHPHYDPARRAAINQVAAGSIAPQESPPAIETSMG